jgi:hypothetical protein
MQGGALLQTAILPVQAAHARASRRNLRRQPVRRHQQPGRRRLRLMVRSRCLRAHRPHRSCDWFGFPTQRSEIRLAGLWDGEEALIEMIAIVLGTNHFMERDFCRTLVTPVALTCTPGHREGAGVLHADIDF